MTAYYNENDPKAAAWLRELIKLELIAPGDVDERSIEDVCPDDLAPYRQCHFFAGIGVWSYALRQAGWPDDRRVWTGSCPCQPFSSAGKGGGFDDERHLWPAWFWLISQCRPGVVFGEQVASRDGLAWLDLVCSDLEGAGYAIGAADLCAAGFGAPHIRQRLFFVAHAERGTTERYGPQMASAQRGTESEARQQRFRADVRAVDSGDGHRLGDADGPRPQGPGGSGIGPGQRSAWSSGVDPWESPGFVLCADGRPRPAAPIARRLDYGVSERVGLLRGYGNAIVPQVAATFIRSFVSALEAA